MTEHAPAKIWSGIDVPKTIAGTLAAVSAAFLGSFLGVAGTLIGAAVASIVGTVGTELYTRFIHRGTTTIKSTFVTAPAAIGTPPVAAAEEEVPSDEPVTPAPPVKMRWGRLALVAGAVFMLAMGSLLAVELFMGRSVADAVGNKTSSSTTIGSVFGSDSKKTPAPSESATTEPSEAPETTAPTGTPTAEPSADPTETTPTTAPTTDPQQPGGTDQGTTPTGEPTQAPADGQTDTQDNSQLNQQQSGDGTE